MQAFLNELKYASLTFGKNLHICHFRPDALSEQFFDRKYESP